MGGDDLNLKLKVSYYLNIFKDLKNLMMHISQIYKFVRSWIAYQVASI